ncbi:CLUMA_CG017884, isoform A [Clunio marinus]|uniref:CLUMA_CG017884, isoform A n=1 Tax=Clunio marinus TaxID=568069 RepID=A0A1J1IXF9_9DIPT|nr:CLUMA_CG017884, isoform A [Clunio marinus]
MKKCSTQQSFKISKNDESDDDNVDSRKIYNLTDILTTPSSGFYIYEHHQQKQSHEELHYKPFSSSNEKTKTKDRYYIYSHVKTAKDDEDDMNHSDNSRKIRSSVLSDRKQVSRNISMVLENLLMSYENSQLPTHGEGLSFSYDYFGESS